MKRNILTTALLLCSALICFAAAITDLTGKWKGNIKMADGTPIPLTYIFKVDGDKITGSVLSPQGELPIYDGKITSEKDFSFKVDVNDNPVPSVGKFYGDSVTVVADLNGERLHSTLKRVIETKN
ncbi:MAG: glycoside hydrolase [Bacteroidota bacterium]